jgi:peptide/nickel transport system substrate-binding protein
MVNPLLDVAKVLPRSVYPENYGGYEDPKLIEIYNSMLRETDPAKQRAKMREFETYALDTQVDTIMTPWWNRIIVQRSYMKGWKISPSHYLNLNLANIWLDK